LARIEPASGRRKLTRHDVAAVRALAPASAVYLELTHSAGALKFERESWAYGTAGTPALRASSS